MIIFPTTNISLIESILNDPQLFAMTDGQGSSHRATVSPGFEYLICMRDRQVIGMFSIKKVTNLIFEGHIRILPKYWKTVFPKEALDQACKYISSLGCTKVMTTVPGNCHHVLRFLESNSFKRCGEIHEGIIYNDELVSLLYFERVV